MHTITIIAATSIIFVLLDSVYLSLMSSYLNNQIKMVQGSSVKLNMTAAVLCYISLIFGLYYFILKDKRSIIDAFLLGLVIYSVYELTTLASLKNWFVTTAVIDTLWGGILFALTTTFVYKLSNVY